MLHAGVEPPTWVLPKKKEKFKKLKFCPKFYYFF